MAMDVLVRFGSIAEVDCCSTLKLEKYDESESVCKANLQKLQNRSPQGCSSGYLHRSAS